MKLVRALLLFAGVLGWTPARGDITLVTDSPIGTPLVMNAGSVSSGTMVVSINSNAADLLLGWQTTLWILPTGGTGTVDFNSSVGPVDYVFGTRSGVYGEDLSFGGNSDAMFAMDANISGGTLLPPVAAPGDPGLDLLELDFSASLDASGSFGLFAVGGAGRSEWTDTSLNAVLFGNINSTFDSHTQIGEIFVNQVPAPGAAVLGLLGLSFVGRFRRRYA